MRQKKISESLTIRVFLITAFLLLFAGAITFGFIAWVAPSTYTAVMNDDLAAQVDVLVKQLADTEPEDCGKLLDKFTLSSGATAILTGSDGHLVDTGAQIEVQTVYEAGDMLVTTTEGDSSVSFGTIESSLENTVAITMSEQSTIATEGALCRTRGELYALYHSATQGRKCGSTGTSADGSVASAGADNIFSAVCLFLLQIYHPTYCADE